MRRTSSRRKAALALLLIALAFIVTLAAGNRFLSGVRFDATEDRLFSLSSGAKTISATLKKPVTLTYYWSDSGATGLPQLKTYGQRIADLLGAFERAGAGRIRLVRVDPEPFSEQEEEAAAHGLRPVRGPAGENLYLGLVGTEGGTKREVIEFFAPDREPQLEYDLANLLYRLSGAERPKVAVLSSLPLAFGPGGALALAQGQSQAYLAYEQVRALFDVVPVGTDFAALPAGIKALVIVHPPALTSGQLRAIDRYVSVGGRLLLFVDPLQELAAAQGLPQGPRPPALTSTLEPLLRAWGVAFDPAQVVLDGQYAQTVEDRQGQSLSYLPWLAVPPEGLARTDLITSGLRQLNLASAGWLRVQTVPGVQVQVLMQSSPLAMLTPMAPLRYDPDPQALLHAFKPGGQRYPLAVRLQGRLPSAFGMTPVHPATVVVVSDADLWENALWTQTQSVMGQSVYAPFADNGQFILNAVSVLAGSPHLASLQARGASGRPFVLLELLRRQGERRFLNRVALLQADVRATEARIGALEASQTAAQKVEITRLRAKALMARRDLRAVQRDLRADMDRVQRWVAAGNIFGAPLLGLGVAFWVGRRLRRFRG